MRPSLSPDRDSHNLKILRVNYQTYLFLNFYKKDLVPCPLNNGWTLDNGKCVPLRYSKPPLPKDLAGSLQNVFDIEMPMYEESDGDSDYSDTEYD